MCYPNNCVPQEALALTTPPNNAVLFWRPQNILLLLLLDAVCTLRTMPFLFIFSHFGWIRLFFFILLLLSWIQSNMNNDVGTKFKHVIEMICVKDYFVCVFNTKSNEGLKLDDLFAFWSMLKPYQSHPKYTLFWVNCCVHLKTYVITKSWIAPLKRNI